MKKKKKSRLILQKKKNSRKWQGDTQITHSDEYFEISRKSLSWTLKRVKSLSFWLEVFQRKFWAGTRRIYIYIPIFIYTVCE